MKNTILEVKELRKNFAIERGIWKNSTGKVEALKGVSFSVGEFDTLGIVGESGSGKTTLAKILLGLIPATSGKVFFNPCMIKNFRKDVQIIFQNPYNSLNPKMRIIDSLAEPLIIHRIVAAGRIRDKVIELLGVVGLSADVATRYPVAFSGGQRQRICIARALACEPKLIVLDEPISSLDLTIQAKLLELFMDLKQRFRLTYIFISHNLALIKHITDSVLVMQNGLVIEQAQTQEIFNRPKEEYTKQLLEAARS